MVSVAMPNKNPNVKAPGRPSRPVVRTATVFLPPREVRSRSDRCSRWKSLKPVRGEAGSRALLEEVPCRVWGT